MADTPTENVKFPPASLNVLVSTLATQALVALGQMVNPATNKAEANLPFAKHLIDTLDVLETKTKGNREPEETQLLEGALHQLRMIYLEANR
jgi:hypothetical protein